MMWPRVWHGPETRIFTGIAWTLCYEEQFYFICFLALLARRPAPILLAVTSLSLAYLGTRGPSEPTSVLERSVLSTPAPAAPAQSTAQPSAPQPATPDPSAPAPQPAAPQPAAPK